MTPEELGMTPEEVQAAQAQAEASFPIVDLYDELMRVVSLDPLEDSTVMTKQELKDAITASRNLSIKPGMPPRYDLFHNVCEFVRVRLDAPFRAYSVLLPQWVRKYKTIIPLYDYRGYL